MSKVTAIPQPLRLLAWMELPYFVGVDYDEVHAVEFHSHQSRPMRIRLRNDLFRISDGNSWVRSSHPPVDVAKEHQARARGEVPVLLPLFATGGELESLDHLAHTEGYAYLHVEETNTVVELEAKVPLEGEFTPEGLNDVGPGGLLPMPGFFTRQVLPILDRVIEAYRLAAIPAMRFAIHPVSEALVNSASVEIRDAANRSLYQIGYRFDARASIDALQHHADRLGVAGRFHTALADPDALEPEAVFSSAYYLFHMRRWTEAVTIASSVVDKLLRRLVLNEAGEAVGKKLWSAYRNRPRDVFLDLLPAYGLPNISVDEPELWAEFLKAKANRGAAAHGEGGHAFDEVHAHGTQESLLTFYRVARWLSNRLGRTWFLDVMDDGMPLREFG